ncbi:hypothetical protein K503DRAFT_858887 [Rhizopogon vinicolor AM-OR11-026]|uniref:Uncharacterized protein n=1 Tax=Rhizopogon vinicolor AM-OR11-026 TaxID=1314800 RepID=A0A1B7MQU6_9AGAM|nr:hypothetical protein K503DRAFT_858887 [Rhizopogon vinicolor AM-OR11-026]
MSGRAAASALTSSRQRTMSTWVNISRSASEGEGGTCAGAVTGADVFVRLCSGGIEGSASGQTATQPRASGMSFIADLRKCSSAPVSTYSCNMLELAPESLGVAVDVVPEGHNFRSHGCVLGYYTIETADFVDTAGKARLGIMRRKPQMCSRVLVTPRAGGRFGGAVDEENSSSYHLYILHATMGLRAQGQGVDEVPEGYHFSFDLIVPSNHVLERADLVDIASEAGFGLAQFCAQLGECTVHWRKDRGFCICGPESTWFNGAVVRGALREADVGTELSVLI